MEAKKTLLIVDDDPYILSLLTQLVEDDEGFHVRAVNSAAAALSLMENEEVHVLLTDQMMPGMTGNDLLSRVAEKHPDTCRILITASTDLHIAMEAINKGKIFAYLNKPIDEEQLFSILKKAREISMEKENQNRMIQQVEKIISDSQIDSYRIVQKIGEGGMGNIYKAWCEEEKRFVALKVLKEKVHSPLDIERFKRETLACERVNHSGVVKIYAKGECNNRLYIAEELLEGEGLNELIMKLEGVDLPRYCCIGRGIIRILRAIHENQIIHRDLKPSNIYILNRDGCLEDRIKILDFGIARYLDLPRITQSGVLEGTAEFIAPESMTRYHAPTPAVDIYAYGIILYYLFFQISPYENLSIKDIIQQKMEGEISIPDREEIPRDIEGLIRGLTKRNPDERMVDYHQIEEILSGQIEKAGHAS